MEGRYSEFVLLDTDRCLLRGGSLSASSCLPSSNALQSIPEPMASPVGNPMA